ncbi:unnamed protein product [Triticum turgidum subsp. durum]|uniref:Sucrose transporter n=1 Tax=Triticum turgidum subsp. durum TaxID=4567 RepID=A0A9R0QQD6_TRITD|nr:unnamed protein product [Triticum turgidum subsp. durum]
MWLCGPIAGLIVQPCVGLSSDKCGSPLGRRRPFILSGCIVISISVIIVGFSSDIGYALGDTKEDCKDYTGPRYRAAAAFILGFWLLDFSNNTVQLASATTNKFIKSGLLKRGEEGDGDVVEDGDDDQHDLHDDGSPNDTPAPPGERG